MKLVGGVALQKVKVNRGKEILFHCGIHNAYFLLGIWYCTITLEMVSYIVGSFKKEFLNLLGLESDLHTVSKLFEPRGSIFQNGFLTCDYHIKNAKK